MDNLEQAIKDAAQRPASAASDGVSVTQHKLQDLIAVDKYLQDKEAINKPNRGLRYNKLIPPGAD